MEYPMENREPRKRLSVGMGLFLMCLVLTTVVGLFCGLMISNYTHNNYVMYAEKAETASVQKQLHETAPTAAVTTEPVTTSASTGCSAARNAPAC